MISIPDTSDYKLLVSKRNQTIRLVKFRWEITNSSFELILELTACGHGNF